MIGYRTLTRTLEARGVKLRASGPKLDCLQVVCNRGDISHREKKLIEKYTPEILNILKERAAYRYLFDNTDSIIHGDSAEVLKKFPGNCFDQLVIDPNYGIGFMGKESCDTYTRENTSGRRKGGRWILGIRNLRHIPI